MKPAPIILATAALAIGAWSLLNPTTQAAQKLLPFQGRLTDASGAPVADGAKVVQFKIYDAPTGGTAVWNGEVQKVTVNGGLVSTLLGSKADLSAVDFNQALYLEITVDANADNQITAADPPLLPRQSVLPAVFAVETLSARDSQKLAGADWSSIMVNSQGAAINSPNGSFIQGSRLVPGSVGAAQIGGSIAGSGLVAATGVLAVNTDDLSLEIASGKVQVKAGGIDLNRLAIPVRETLVPVGTILSFGGTTPPSGYFICDGAQISRTTFSALYAVLGNNFGSGNGSSTFSLPDLRGTFLRGRDGGRNMDPDRSGRTASGSGGAIGDAVGSFQADAFQGHRHQLIQPSGGGGWPGAYNAAIVNDNAAVNTSGQSGSAINDVFGAARVTTETRPKNVSINYIIKY